ncbi:MAG: hypothetical protein ACKO1K_01790 [Burkholderiales bacterium]
MSNSRKSSSQVNLVLISAAAVATLAGCAQEQTRRDVYANKEDCLADWGNSPADCQPAYDHPHSRGASTAYYGRPYVYRDSAGSPSRTGKTIGSSATTSRGGFGSSGKSASSSGG